jgi:hypothetical protein
MSLAFALVVNTPRECLLHCSITVQFYTTENATEEGNRQEETSLGLDQVCSEILQHCRVASNTNALKTVPIVSR